MATNARSLVVGIFTDHYEAERAIDTLQRAGFAADHIHYMERGAATTEYNISKDALVKLGIPEEDADYYQNEFNAGRTIVVVRAPDRSEEATNILRENGAYNVHTRRGV